MIDAATLQQLAHSLPDNGELPYADRSHLRNTLATQSLDNLLRLETICARRTLPVWQAAFPDNSRPTIVMDQALSTPTDSRLLTTLNDLKTQLENAFELGENYFPAIYAGFACWATARNAAGHRPHEPDAPAGELDLEPDQWSPCFLASLAETGGATWEPNTDPDKRRTFWQWYLLDAIPAAQHSR